MVRRKVILPSWNVSEEVSTDVNALKERFTDFSTGEIVINTTPENVTLSTLDSNGNLSTFIGETKVSEMISNALDASNYATEEFVKESIASAELGGEGGEVDLSEYAKKTDIEGFVTEEWIGKQGFITEHQDITGKQNVIEDLEVIREGAAKGATALQEVPEGYATEAWVGEQGFLTEHQDITGKQNVIDDLEAIREGAAKGATALQEVPTEYVTETELVEMNYATVEQVNAKQDTIDDLETIRSGAAAGATALQEVPEGYATEAWVGEQGFLTEHQDISGLATKEEVATMNTQIQSISAISHTHENKEVLDGITSDDISKWNEPHEYLPLSGGSLDENAYIMFSGGGYSMKIFPEKDASMAIGGPENRFADVHSEFFHGTLQGVAYSANTVPFTGIPTGTTSETVAAGNHTHEYLPLSGGTIEGILQTLSYGAAVRPLNDGNGTIGELNRKYSNVYSYDVTSENIHTNKLTITTKNDGNVDIIEIDNTSSGGGFGYNLRYLGAGEGNDNALALYSDESGDRPLFKILQDGQIVGNNIGDSAVKTLVTSAKTSGIASTVPFSGLPTGTTSETVAVGNHEHEIYATKTELNGIEGRVSALETEHNTLVLDKDKTFKVLPEEYDFGPVMSLNTVTPYFILRNESGTYYNIENLNISNANFGIEEGSYGIFSSIIKCKPIEVENKNDNDIILLSVVSASTKYIDSSGVVKEQPFGVFGIKNRTVSINGEPYNPNCIVQKNSTFKVTVPTDVTSRMEEFRKETITIDTESNLDFFTPGKIWKEVRDNRGVVTVFEFRVPYFKTGGYSDTNLFMAKYNLKLDSLPNTNVSNEYGVVIDKIKYHHDLILPESPTIGKKIEIINKSLYGHKILAEGKNITYSFNNSLQMVSGDDGIENTNKMVTCISDGEEWYIYKNM